MKENTLNLDDFERLKELERRVGDRLGRGERRLLQHNRRRYLLRVKGLFVGGFLLLAAIIVSGIFLLAS